MAISPDGKWVITKPAKGGPLSLVPTGAGEARPLTHDAISYGTVRFLPDGKRLLASGIEAGHGGRDYLIDLSSGDSKPITPEGIAGVAHLTGRQERSGAWTRWKTGNLAARRGRVSSHTRARIELRHHWLDGGRRVGICGSQSGGAR